MCACAASQMTFNLYFLAISMMGSMSAGWPYKCTGIMAFVFSVIAASILVTSMLYVFSSISTNLTFARAWVMASVVAMNVLGTVMTSAPGPMRSAVNAK